MRTTKPKPKQKEKKNMAHYYISTGERSVFYTLRKVFKETVYGRGYVENGVFRGEIREEIRDWHVQSLSRDLNRAKKKAEQIVGRVVEVGKYAAEQIMNAPRDARSREDIDDTVFHFGKFGGKPIAEIFESEPEYVLWVATEYSSSDIAVQMNIEHCRELAADLIKQREEENRQKKLAAIEREEGRKRAAMDSQFVGQPKDRLELTVMVEKEISFPSSFVYNETVVIYIMRTTDGNEIVWKTSGSCNTQLTEHWMAKIKATVKEHTIYEKAIGADTIPTNQTIVNRVALVEEWLPEEENADEN